MPFGPGTYGARPTAPKTFGAMAGGMRQRAQSAQGILGGGGSAFKTLGRSHQRSQRMGRPKAVRPLSKGR